MFLLVVFIEGVHYGIPMLPALRFDLLNFALLIHVYAILTPYPHAAVVIFIKSMYIQIFHTQVYVFEGVCLRIITYYAFIINTHPDIAFTVFFYDIDDGIGSGHISGKIPCPHDLVVLV